MSDSLNKLWLKGQAEEDIYFAERDRELIAALRKKRGRNQPDDSTVGKKKKRTNLRSTPESDSKRGSKNNSDS
jgi:hypothetical protein